MPLDPSTFAALPESTRLAFLAWDDAVSDVQAAYADRGLLADPADPTSRRVVRVVTLPAGTRLFKLTQWPERGDRQRLSPWWSRVEPADEDDLGARGAFETALLNGVSLREFVRFASAVTLEWNRLDLYVEVRLIEERPAYWGQFAPQAGRQGGDPDGVTVEPNRDEAGAHDELRYEGEDQPVYLPSELGGVGSWQLFVPDLTPAAIDRSPAALVNLDATDDQALARHLGVSSQRLDELHRLGERLKP